MKTSQLIRSLKMYKWNYAMILPGIILLFLFAYMPMYGILIAFKKYEIYKGISGSPWLGFQNFYFLKDGYFWESFLNTIYITILRLVFGFPAPIILALLLNEIRNPKFKKSIQSITYLPHFISWIVVAYMLQTLLALDTGIINNMLSAMGKDQINFMGDPSYFRPIVIISAIWKDIGWDAIIYLAALASISQEQLESATLDGAGRFQRIWYINIPGIMPTISILLILYMPRLLSAGYEQIYPLVNPANLAISNVLDVYIIRLGLGNSQFSVATAIGFASASIQLLLVLFVNYIIKKRGQDGLW